MWYTQRRWQHVGFWLVYFSITLFNELFLTSDFSGNLESDHLFKVVITELILLSVKVAFVYLILYRMMPRWQRPGWNFWRIIPEAILLLLATTALYRLIIQYINWPLVFRQVPGPFTAASMIARYCFSLLEILQVTGIAATIRLFRLRLHEAEREKELLRVKTRTEIAQLKAQINPHFLFNMLNSLYALSREQSAALPEVVLRLSQLLRYMLYESEKERTTLEAEVSAIADFLELQKIRFGLRVRIEQELLIPEPSTPIAPLLILPLVENAFKHGVGTREDDSFISVSLRLQEHRLAAEIRNSIGLNSVREKEGEGLGLSNLRRQLALQYTDYHFTTAIEDGTFRASLDLNTTSYASA